MTSSLPPLRVLVFMEAREFGGPAKNLVDTIALLGDRVDFRVVTFIRGSAQATEFTERLAEARVPFSVIRERFRYDPRGLGELRKVVSSYDPHIAQIHNNKSRFYMYVLRSLGLVRGFETIDCYHGETWTDRKQLAYNQLDRWLFRRAKNVIVVSKAQEELLVGFGVAREKITVVYNGIRLVPSRYRPAHKPVRVVTIGRLSKEKGHGVLVEAVRTLVDEGVGNFIVTVVGDGPELSDLETQARTKQLDDVISYVGYQSNPVPYYEGADVFVLPSLSEGIPNVLLEAAMHCVPIVTTPVGGITEMFEAEGEAVFVEPGDADALAAGMKRLLMDPDLRERLAVAARRRVEQQFTQESRAERYLAYYTALVENGASTAPSAPPQPG